MDPALALDGRGVLMSNVLTQNFGRMSFGGPFSAGGPIRAYRAYWLIQKHQNAFDDLMSSNLSPKISIKH